MIPILVSKEYDIYPLYDSNNKAVFDSENFPIYVRKANPTVPTTNGLGRLIDAETCIVTQELNGQFELEMQYPMDGELFDKISVNDLIMAKPDKTSTIQPFRIYRISKPLDGTVTIYARHLAYDLMGIVVKPFSVSGIQNAVRGIKTNSMVHNPFNIVATSRSSFTDFVVTRPTSAWALLGEGEGSLLETYGGEYTFDGYTIRFDEQRGSDNGVSVRYGVNMTEFEQDEDYSNFYTGVVGYWEQNGESVTGNVINATGEFDHVRILPVDFSQYYDEAPTKADIDELSDVYIKSNKLWEPNINWTVNFVPLDDTEEYKDIAPLEHVSLGDTVGVKYSRIGVSVKARAIGIKWDVLDNKYESVSLGEFKRTLVNRMASTTKMMEYVNTLPDNDKVRDLAAEVSGVLTKRILGAEGGSARFLDENNDGELDTLYIANNKNPEMATKVWRFNYEGWAASDNGYNGPFKMGATLEDGILADFITAAHLVAGSIQSADGVTFTLNLDTGELVTNRITANGGVIGGCSIENGILNIDNAHISSINADLITAGTINTARLSSSAQESLGYVNEGTKTSPNQNAIADNFAAKMLNNTSANMKFHGNTLGLISISFNNHTYRVIGVEV